MIRGTWLLEYYVQYRVLHSRRAAISGNDCAENMLAVPVVQLSSAKDRRKEEITEVNQT